MLEASSKRTRPGATDPPHGDLQSFGVAPTGSRGASVTARPPRDPALIGPAGVWIAEEESLTKSIGVTHPGHPPLPYVIAPTVTNDVRL